MGLTYNKISLPRPTSPFFSTFKHSMLRIAYSSMHFVQCRFYKTEFTSVACSCADMYVACADGYKAVDLLLNIGQHLANILVIQCPVC